MSSSAVYDLSTPTSPVFSPPPSRRSTHLAQRHSGSSIRPRSLRCSSIPFLVGFRTEIVPFHPSFRSETWKGRSHSTHLDARRTHKADQAGRCDQCSDVPTKQAAQQTGEGVEHGLRRWMESWNSTWKRNGRKQKPNQGVQVGFEPARNVRNQEQTCDRA